MPKLEKQLKQNILEKSLTITLEIKGFQFGISYIADKTNTGYTSLNEPIYHTPVKPSPHFISFKDWYSVWAYI